MQSRPAKKRKEHSQIPFNVRPVYRMLLEGFEKNPRSIERQLTKQVFAQGLSDFSSFSVGGINQRITETISKIKNTSGIQRAQLSRELLVLTRFEMARACYDAYKNWPTERLQTQLRKLDATIGKTAKEVIASGMTTPEYWKLRLERNIILYLLSHKNSS